MLNLDRFGASRDGGPEGDLSRVPNQMGGGLSHGWAAKGMGFTIFEPALDVANEVDRELAVTESGALSLMGDPELASIVAAARQAFGTKMAAISIVHQDWQYLIAADGLPGGVYDRRSSFCGHAIRSGQPLFWVADAERDPRFAGNPAVLEGLRIRFYAGAVLRAADGIALGTLCVFDTEPRSDAAPIDPRLFAPYVAAALARIDAAAGRRDREGAAGPATMLPNDPAIITAGWQPIQRR